VAKSVHRPAEDDAAEVTKNISLEKNKRGGLGFATRLWVELSRLTMHEELPEPI
jgi:hypothetical protein